MSAQTTYTLLATVSPVGINYVSFTNIPQTYTDLVLIGYSRSAQAVNSPQWYIYENNDTSTNRACTQLVANGGSPTASRNASSPFIPSGYTVGANATSTVFAGSETHYFQYANTSMYKTSITRSFANASSFGVTEIQAKCWPSTNAISSLVIQNDSNNNWATGTVFSLYGIVSA